MLSKPNLDTSAAEATCGDSGLCGALSCTNSCSIDNTSCFNCLKRIFVSAATTTGNLGGVEGGDGLCEANVNKPSTGQYRALLSDASALTANTDYVRPNGTAIGSTDASGVRTFPLINSIGSRNTHVNTGLTDTFATHANTCADWTSASHAMDGHRGKAGMTDAKAVSNNDHKCDFTRALYCVEQ